MITAILSSSTTSTITAQAEVIIGGRKVDPYQASIEQNVDTHHRFTVAVSAEKIEGTSIGVGIDNSINYIGQAAQLVVHHLDNILNFVGIITGVHIDRTYVGDNHIVFTGYSPTYLLEDGVGTKSYANKNLSQLVSEITQNYPTNILNPSIQPVYQAAIPYVVRYKETNYQFLSRMAALHGEWFYYDGQGIVFGKMPNPDSIEVVLGKDLNSFDYGVNLRPSKFKSQYYNYEENRMVENSSANFKPGWLDRYGKKALDAADAIFPNEPIDPMWQEARQDAVLRHLVEARRSSILSDTELFIGRSTNPAIAIGARIRVKAANQNKAQNTLVHVGNFRIISVRHHLDANKGYRNEFKAIPLTVTAPPVNKHIVKPEAEAQIAVVVDNNDPQKLGRVRAQFKWQRNGEITPWVRFVTGTAGGDRGLYFLPEIGDEVYVDFEQGNPDRPYVQGTFHNGNTSPEYFDPNNNLKSIKTRAGHTLLFNDKNGEESIRISDKSGNIILLDAVKGSITISAPEDMILDCKNMIINVKENMQTSVGSNKITEIGADSMESVGGSKAVIVESKMSMASKSDAVLTSETQTVVNGSNSAVVTGAKVSAIAKSSFIAQASNGTAVLMGKKGVAVDSSKGVASLTGKDQVNIEAKGGATVIKGEPIKLN